ncbi:FimV/HubP family polar landmark protein [Aliikangiella maris]|uniref:FimV/HubP family polar landmark protein n=2 Tax=Aliikangiella maris TaxID=3162458 RepID=A0ABV3MKF6_9GAMM
MVQIQGNTRMFRKIVLFLTSAVGFFSGAVFAVGLGEYQLSSGLNQPLKAEIRLLSAGDLGDHEIHASLASMVEFEKVGVERLFYLTNIKFETKKNSDGSMSVFLSTREPVKEPFMNFLVELNWPNGRIIREYTFLLDPPVFDDSAASTIQKSQTVAAKKKPVTSQPATTSNSNQSSNNYPENNYSGGTSYGPVSENDTLWGIANQVRPQSASIHQTLVAIYRANPEAFGNGNINNLLKGKVLTIPEDTVISQVPHRAALQDVVMQNNQWRSGGARNIADTTSSRATSRLSNEARLTLSTPENSSESNSSQSASGNMAERLNNIQNQLAQSQEESATLQNENNELRARLADALKKLESVQSGSAVDVSDAELAALSQIQRDSEKQNLSADMDSDETLISESVEPTSVNGQITDAVSSQTDNSESGNIVDRDVINNDAELANETNQSPTETASQTKANQPAVTRTPSIPAKPQKSFLDEILESSVILWSAIGGIILVIVAVFWRMRKRMEDEEFQDDLVTSTGAGLGDATDTFELPEVGDNMLEELDMDDQSMQDSGTNEEENFDPLGEADIYIAYGKYEQAENLLLEAIDDNPIRSDLKVKLMECYAENDDRDKFESLAQEVSHAVDAEEWHEQINKLRENAWSGEIGDGLDDGFDLPSTEDIFNEDDIDLDDDTSPNVDMSDNNIDDAESALDLNEEDDSFDIDNDELADDEFDIDMDMNLDDDAQEVPPSEAVTETFDSLDDDDFSLEEKSELDDFVLDEDDEEIGFSNEDDLSLDIEDDSEFALEDDNDFDDDDIGEGDAGDEIATKLDLARAYIDMGDSEGAKEILSEVIAEGTDAQKEEAQALIDRAD